MSTPSYFSPYAALAHDREAHTLEARRVAFVLLGSIAIFLVCLLYLKLQAYVAVRSEQVQALAIARADKLRENRNLASDIARETSPQQVELRAKRLGLQPITKFEPVVVPGISKMKLSGQIANSGPTLASKSSENVQNRQGSSPQLIWAQITTWLGLGPKPAEARGLAP